MSGDNRADISIFMFRAVECLKEIHHDAINKWGADSATKVLFFAIKFCDLMAKKYGDNRADISIFMLRAAECLKEIYHDAINKWGADSATKVLFFAIKFCDLMAKKYREEADKGTQKYDH